MSTIIRVPQTNQLQRILRDTYLKFLIEQDTPAILAVEYVQEVIVVPSTSLNSMPNMPNYILGLLNRRNKILWVIDLAQMLNLKAFTADTKQYNLAIIKVGQIPLGIVVYAVQGVTQFAPENLQSVQGLVTSTLAYYLHGCILQQQEILLVLKAEAIVQSLVIHNT
ncbi:MAG: purine-binding chemotaxis protein CheW [Chroococcidiopsidaceae cyanobacterium CP_BM_ER_R8_30]|nr:purine-binding chemotaxis protein CheW [Chroococcidiopsidaceae cyanobacterium CP_BM_ER_R8_30]